MPRTEPFENHYQEYENWFEINKLAYESELRAVRMHIPRSKLGVEIGAGSGRFAAPLGIKYGVEPSARMGKIARQRGTIIIRGTAEALPLKNESFDYALMVTTICFLDNIRLAFQETNRILKPGGNFIIGFIDKNSPLGKKYQKIKNKSHFYKIAIFYSTEEIVEYLKICGFGRFSFSQTLFKNIEEMREVDPTRKGFGEGSFVIINARKEK